AEVPPLTRRPAERFSGGLPVPGVCTPGQELPPLRSSEEVRPLKLLRMERSRPRPGHPGPSPAVAIDPVRAALDHRRRPRDAHRSRGIIPPASEAPGTPDGA